MNGGVKGANAPFYYMKTARGVYYNLKESEYTVTIEDVKFYFSSQVKLKKFINGCESEINRFNESLNRVYKNKFNIQLDIVALIRLYTLIESNGFYIIFEGIEITCPEDLIFVGTMIYKRKSEE